MKAVVVVVVGTSGAKQFEGSSEVTPRKKFAVGTFKHTHTDWGSKWISSDWSCQKRRATEECARLFSEGPEA